MVTSLDAHQVGGRRPAAVAISVVVPTHDRAGQVVRLLRALGRQDTDPATFEVVVVDDASTDGTASLVGDLGPSLPYRLVVVALVVNSGAATARNRGWRASEGPRVAFVDDDCVPAPGWLDALSAGLDRADIAVGRTRPPAEQMTEVGPFSSYLDIGHNRTYSTCNIAYRRQVLEAVGGFDECEFTTHWLGRRAPPNAEDTDLGLRAVKAGYGDVFVPGAVVFHDVRPSDFRAHLRSIASFEALIALVGRHPEARQEVLGAGWFLRSVDKAVLCCWAALLVAAARPRHRLGQVCLAGSGVVYVWQFGRSHYPPRRPREWALAVPLGFLADSWAVFVMARGSLRRRTLLL